ncbi:MAG: DUF262 domain-containing protein [Chloroflexi bacterium]|nr:DUF262 domain-containing protein [Chloroflexota bacterium]
MDRAKLPDKQCSVYALVDLLEQGKIWLTPPYQRRLVWGEKDRKLLLDSIAKDYDIGKFFPREVKDKPYDYEVIDGQQRLDTLRRFKRGEIAFPDDSGPELAGKTFTALQTPKQIELGGYGLDVLVIKNADENQVREMFRRLQLGKPLTSGERLKASYGKMHDFIEGQVLKDDLFDGLLGFKNKRDVYFEVASQMMRLCFEGQACDIKYKNLEEMYYQNQNTLDDTKQKQCLKDFEFYSKVLKEDGGTFHPDKANSVSLFLFVSTIRRGYVVEPEALIKFTKALEQKRHTSPLLDTELEQYNKALFGGTGVRRSPQFRLNTLMKRFLAEHPDVQQLDDKRVLTPEQRLAVYWRDKGRCQICSEQVSDKEFEIHHTEAWYKGGPTTVNNSQTLCKACHKQVTNQQKKL